MIRTFKIYSWEFPGGLVIITLCSHCQGPGFDPWLGTKISQAMKHSQNKQIKNVKKDLFCLQFSNMQYTIVNCSYHVIHYFPRTYLFFNWKFLPFDSPHSFHIFPAHPASPPPTATNLFSVSYACVCVCVFWLPCTSTIIQCFSLSHLLRLA